MSPVIYLRLENVWLTGIFSQQNKAMHYFILCHLKSVKRFLKKYFKDVSLIGHIFVFKISFVRLWILLVKLLHIMNILFVSKIYPPLYPGQWKECPT